MFDKKLHLDLHLADASVFLTCAMTLTAFDISKVVENGATIEPSGEYYSGTIRRDSCRSLDTHTKSFPEIILNLLDVLSSPEPQEQHR